MPRRRMIDPNFWESEDVSRCAPMTRLVFLGLVSMADDEGRGRAKPQYVKSALFPYDDWIRIIDIETALSEIALNLSVTFYEVGGAAYYQLDHWHNWQRIDRPKPSKLPAPGESTIDRRSIDDASCLKEDKEIKTESETEEKENPPDMYGEFGNVHLKPHQLKRLQQRHPDWEQKIEYLSAYMASSGKQYRDHFATICAWSARDALPGGRKEMLQQEARKDAVSRMKQQTCSGVDPIALRAMQQRMGLGENDQNMHKNAEI